MHKWGMRVIGFGKKDSGIKKKGEGITNVDRVMKS